MAAMGALDIRRLDNGDEILTHKPPCPPFASSLIRVVQASLNLTISGRGVLVKDGVQLQPMDLCEPGVYLFGPGEA